MKYSTHVQMLIVQYRLVSYFTKAKANRQETISQYGTVIGEENIPKM
jgi:hypothetical protein